MKGIITQHDRSKKIKPGMWFIRHFWQFWVSVAALGVALGLLMAGLNGATSAVLAVAAGGLLLPLLTHLLRDLRAGKYGVDILAALTIVTALAMQEYWAALVIVIMFTGGEALEDFAQHRAKSELSALLEQSPRKAHVLRGRKIVDVQASEVKAGDKLVIRAGEQVPVDCRILEGVASLDESSLTGESLPQTKAPGDTLLSGSINLDGLLTVRATETAEHSQYARIIALVKTASANQAPFVRLADMYAVPFTLFSLTLALAAWYFSGESERFLEVLVIATPCPLILAAPIAIISGMSRAARHGIIIKTGGALERLAAARTFAFDKTGTITKGQPVVKAIKTLHGCKASEVLSYAAGLEQHSNHSLARAVVDHAEKRRVKLFKAAHVREIAGVGLSARVNGKQITVGRLSSLSETQVSAPTAFRAAAYKQTAAFVAIDDKLAGVITFVDEIRPEAKHTLARLRKLGVRRFLMLTGDNKTTAKSVAKSVGISDVKAEALPGDKVRAMEAVDNRPVAFVGDGVNDAPVLTASDVGIALGARGSAAASEAADVVVMLDDLERVAKSREIASRSFFIAKQSIFIGIGLSVGLMFAFATGKFKPVYGALAQEVVDVLVIANALRAHGGWRRKTPKTTSSPKQKETSEQKGRPRTARRTRNSSSQ